MRSKGNDIFGFSTAPATCYHQNPIRKFEANPDNRKAQDDLAQKISVTGATDYNKRRLLEMYNSSSVLKAAQNLDCNKFNLVHAQNNVQEINRTNGLGRIAIPSKVSTTGWKELEADEYRLYSIKKHGVVT